MILHNEIDHEEAGVIEPIEIPAWDNPLRETLQRELAAEDLGVARCPACQEPLQVRCDRAGPHFACRCALTPAPRRAA
jgi:hypothetical protein